ELSIIRVDNATKRPIDVQIITVTPEMEVHIDPWVRFPEPLPLVAQPHEDVGGQREAMRERRHACATCAPSGSTNDGRARYARFSWLDSHRIPRIRVVRSKGCGAIGSATVSKTVGCRFESCHPCAVDSAEVSSARRRPRLARTIVKP